MSAGVMQTEYFCPCDAWPRIVTIVQNSFIVKDEHVDQLGHVDFLNLIQNSDDKYSVMIGVHTPPIKEPEPKSLIPWLKTWTPPTSPYPPIPQNHIIVHMNWVHKLSSPLAERIADILTAHGAVCFYP